MRDGSRGETNDKLNRWRSTRGIMSQVKTHSAPAVVEGHERGNEIFVKRFMDSIRSDCEDAVADDFLGVGVKVARYTLACVSRKNSNFNPSFRGFREVVSCSKERGQVGHSCVYIVQVERRFSKLRGGNLDDMVVFWRQSRSGRFAGFRILKSKVAPKWWTEEVGVEQ